MVYNITPRALLTDLLTIASDVVGQYLLKDGTRVPAVGILGLRDARVSEVEGCEVLIDLLPTGFYTYTASTHSMDKGEYRVRVIQHRASQYHMPAVVAAVVSLGHFGSIEYHVEDEGTQSTPFADVTIGRTNIHLTNLPTYDANCPFDRDCTPRIP